MFICDYSSPLGKIKLFSDGESITSLLFDENLTGDYKPLAVFDEAKNWLDVYFSGHSPNFTPKIKISGTEFQKSVYKIVSSIPFGQVMTYSEIAEIIAKSQGVSKISARAVGGAVSHNKILLIIPCHRVIGKNEKLTGYAGGIERKRKLLMLEGSYKL